jgi:hypothetical protein
VYAGDVIALLNAYSELITSGYNVPAIKTANLTIRLIDNHIVNRRAPRLAFTERIAVREIVTNLLEASGFHQIPISDERIEKTGFITPDGHYAYLRMPFGLANAPAVFQRALLNALDALKDSIALVYLDDILIPSTTVGEGLEFLQLLLEALKVAGFSLNILKCKFLQTSVKYLGREISSEGIRPDADKKVRALVSSQSL